MINRAIIEEVADTFDMLPRQAKISDEREAPARILTAAGRAELWAVGAGGAETVKDGTSVRRDEDLREQTAEADEVGATFRR